MEIPQEKRSLGTAFVKYAESIYSAKLSLETEGDIYRSIRRTRMLTFPQEYQLVADELSDKDVENTINYAEINLIKKGPIRTVNGSPYKFSSVDEKDYYYLALS